MATDAYETLIPDEGDYNRTFDIATRGSRESPRERHKLYLRKFGIVEIVFGVVFCTLCITSLLLDRDRVIEFTDENGNKTTYPIKSTATHTSSGLWCGLTLLSSGVLGVLAMKNPTARMYHASMAVAITASATSALMIIFSGFAAEYTRHYHMPAFGIHCTLAALGLASMIVAIVHSAFCCAGVCYGRKVYIVASANYAGAGQPGPGPNGQVVYLPNRE